MKPKLLTKPSTGSLARFLIGVLVLHPFSMLFKNMVHPNIVFVPAEMLAAFNPHHLPMALFFGLLGTVAGLVNSSYINAITEHKERLRLLEELLPVCAY